MEGVGCWFPCLHLGEPNRNQSRTNTVQTAHRQYNPIWNVYRFFKCRHRAFLGFWGHLVVAPEPRVQLEHRVRKFFLFLVLHSARNAGFGFES